MSALPILDLILSVRNLDWVAERDDSGTATNMNSYYTMQEVHCEVLTLNLNAGTMRVRYTQPATNKKGFDTHTVDVTIEHFFQKYSITPVDLYPK